MLFPLFSLSEKIRFSRDIDRREGASSPFSVVFSFSLGSPLHCSKEILAAFPLTSRSNPTSPIHRQSLLPQIERFSVCVVHDKKFWQNFFLSSQHGLSPYMSAGSTSVSLFPPFSSGDRLPFPFDAITSTFFLFFFRVLRRELTTLSRRTLFPFSALEKHIAPRRKSSMTSSLFPFPECR